MTVADDIASPLRLRGGMGGAAIAARLQALAARLHIEPVLKRLPAEPSGGQLQRVALARAVAEDAPLMLLEIGIDKDWTIEIGRGLDFAGIGSLMATRTVGDSRRPTPRRASRFPPPGSCPRGQSSSQNAMVIAGSRVQPSAQVTTQTSPQSKKPPAWVASASQPTRWFGCRFLGCGGKI